MALPLKPPIQPQLALSRKVLPEGEEWAYEPKYDGFRALAYVDGDDVYLQSRGGKPLRRYFPEVEFPKGRYVLDGELVILGEDGSEEFDRLQNRLHPAESRVKMLAEKTPALFRAFDALSIDRRKLTGKPFGERRGARAEEVGVRLGRADAALQDRQSGGAPAALRRGRDRQAAGCDLQAGPAQGDGEDQAGADDRLRRHGLAPRQA